MNSQRSNMETATCYVALDRRCPEADVQDECTHPLRDQNRVISPCERPQPSRRRRRDRLHEIRRRNQDAVDGAIGVSADHLGHRQPAHDGDLAVGRPVADSDSRDNHDVCRRQAKPTTASGNMTTIIEPVKRTGACGANTQIRIRPARSQHSQPSCIHRRFRRNSQRTAFWKLAVQGLRPQGRQGEPAAVRCAGAGVGHPTAAATAQRT